MTMLSGHRQLVTLAEWATLPEASGCCYELVEGVVAVVPRPVFRHSTAMLSLGSQLSSQLPESLVVGLEIEVVVDPREPATVRVPDLVVTRAEVAERNPARLQAVDVLLAIEIHSPGTRRTDRVTKVAEYAHAGIPHYWLVEIDDPVTVTVLELRGDRYADIDSGSDTLTVDSPAPLQIDVARLARR